MWYLLVSKESRSFTGAGVRECSRWIKQDAFISNVGRSADRSWCCRSMVAKANIGACSWSVGNAGTNSTVSPTSSAVSCTNSTVLSTSGAVSSIYAVNRQWSVGTVTCTSYYKWVDYISKFIWWISISIFMHNNNNNNNLHISMPPWFVTSKAVAGHVISLHIGMSHEWSLN